MVHISFFSSRDAAMHVTEVTGVEQLEQNLRNVCRVSVRASITRSGSTSHAPFWYEGPVPVPQLRGRFCPCVTGLLQPDAVS